MAQPNDQEGRGAMKVTRLCSVEGCEGLHYGKGYCTKHYQRVAKTGTTEIKVRPSVCQVDGCLLPVKGRGLCLKHYSRKRKHGDVNFASIIVGDDKARLLASVTKSETGCWEWQKHKKLGYGVTCLGGRIEQAHRASWKVFVGEIPSGYQVNHKCHNPACINPDHLYVGSQKQNMDDMYAAGRQNKVRGSGSGMAVLNEDGVREIKRMIRNGETNAAIARIFNVAPSTISAIRTFKTWRDTDQGDAA